MMTKSKLFLIAAIAAVGFASPAFAQSFDPSAGTGNSLPAAYDANGGLHEGRVAPRSGQIAVRQSGLNAYAMIPGGPSESGQNAPALTGGGSLGYNETNMIH